MTTTRTSAVTEITTVGQMRAALLLCDDTTPIRDPYGSPFYLCTMEDEIGNEFVEVT